MDFHETFSPVAKQPTIRIFICITLHYNWPITQLDISNAFIHGSLEDEVFMAQPQGFVVFHNSLSNTSLFVKKTPTSLTLLVVCVDDILLTGSDFVLLTQFLQKMHLVFSMKELGSLSYFLGINVIAQDSNYFLCQQKYAIDLLLKAGMVDCKPCSTPLAVKSSASLSDDILFAQPSLYHSLVGGLQYLTITRPDLSLVVNQACQHMHVPTNAHFQNVKRLLRYVKGTVSHGLSFTPCPFTLDAFSDSNWAGDALDRRSTSGYYIFLGPNLISWSAQKQPTVSRFSTEAEYRSLANTTVELSWLQQLLKDFSFPTSSIPTLWCDNLSAMAFASNPVFYTRCKHIVIDYHFIRERVVAKQVVLKYVPTSDQLADLFTKPLSGSRFHYLKDKLMLLPSPISLKEANKIQASRGREGTSIVSTAIADATLVSSVSDCDVG
ncbi:uncharacterized protein LOC114299685 [Camellia sinensis]|uniref:uncharacterized protein LOC114299685 n=1 Tax=Camellia sinensis TaxID=4442 RepID=UPI001035E49F|nr:uncharacterized protein LOC114299685 [Camellia sinensis]